MSDREATLFMVIMMPSGLDITKSTLTSILMFLSMLFILVIYVLEDNMNFDLLLLSIGTIICFLKNPFVVILIFSFTLPELYIML